MKKGKKFYCSIFLLLFVFTACKNTNCENSNPLFNQLQPNDNAYKEVLAKEIVLRGAKKLTFWLEKTFQKDGGKYIDVKIQGKGLCAKAEMMVSEWGKLSGIKQANGGGYAGAELRGLKMEIGRNADSTVQFIYLDIDEIVD